MIIIKIGGGKEINLRGIVKDIGNLNEKFLIIHGANYLRDELAVKTGVEKKILTSVSGYSSVFSDENAIELIMMAYSGLQNKRIVQLCQQTGINAVGLSGIDGRLILGKRNQGIRVREDGKLKIVRDLSGKPKKINTELLNLLLTNGYVPVISIPILDENNFAINTENDDVINVVQQEMKAEKIIQLIEAPGFLDKKDDESSLLKSISKNDLLNIEDKVEGRMKRKIMALRKLFEEGAVEVIISDGRTDSPVADALSGKGTVIK